MCKGGVLKFQGFQFKHKKKHHIPCVRAVALNFKVFVFPFIFRLGSFVGHE